MLADLVDTYLMFAASAIAANTVARSAAGAAAPLFTDQMFTALGVGGGGSLVGGVAAILALIPFCFYKYGETIRIKSRFAPTGPKKQPDDSDQAEQGRAGGEGTTSDETESSSGDEGHLGVAVDEKGDKRAEKKHQGDRESLDTNPYDYDVDDPNPERRSARRTNTASASEKHY